MLKRRLFLIIFFITAVSLINVVVLIEASYQHNTLSVDPINQIIFPADSGNDVINTVAYHQCNYTTDNCDIYYNNANCQELRNGKCKTQWRK